MSKQIDYTEPLRGFEQQPDAAVNEINGLRFTLRRVIEQRDHWMLRYAEVTQQLDAERRLTQQLTAMETRPVVLAQRDSTESNVKEPK